MLHVSGCGVGMVGHGTDVRGGGTDARDVASKARGVAPMGGAQHWQQGVWH